MLLLIREFIMNKKSYRHFIFRKILHNRLALTGGIFIILLSLIAFFAPLIANDKPILVIYQNRLLLPCIYVPQDLKQVDWLNIINKSDFSILPPIPYSPIGVNLNECLLAPSPNHWLGTDENGRDVLARMIHGSRISLQVGIIAVGISLIVGVCIGAMAGYYGGWLDSLISRFIEIMMCFPFFFLVLAVMAFLEPGIYKIMIVIGLTSWTGIARLTRGEFIKIRNEEYILAARCLGLSNSKIIFRHILPNAIAPVLVSATFGIASAVLVESSLTFLGFGVQIPTASWGEILSQGHKYLTIAWWLPLFPGLAIFLTVLAYNLLGEGLRDALDPRLTGSGDSQ